VNVSSSKKISRTCGKYDIARRISSANMAGCERTRIIVSANGLRATKQNVQRDLQPRPVYSDT